MEQPQLSLSRHFEIARRIAEVVLQLHTAGWLHKSLRSENIIFLAPEDSKAEEFLRRSPYLIGYEYARPDTAQDEMFTQLPDIELATDLYRNPLARGVQRQRYRKQFDMYALGCLLLEVGLWQRLVDIEMTYMDAHLGATIQEAADSGKDIELPSLLEFESQERLTEALRHCAGESFVSAVSLCLLMEQTDKEDGDVSLDTQQAVIENLCKCDC